MPMAQEESSGMKLRQSDCTDCQQSKATREHREREEREKENKERTEKKRMFFFSAAQTVKR